MWLMTRLYWGVGTFDLEAEAVHHAEDGATNQSPKQRRMTRNELVQKCRQGIL
jgi:hypothetical protein